MIRFGAAALRTQSAAAGKSAHFRARIQTNAASYAEWPTDTTRTREELEKAARAEAEEYFGSTELNFVGADVTAQDGEPSGRTYEGTFRFELKTKG
jgi:hypothetical protein